MTDFAGSPSAIRKAKHVLKDVSSSGLDLATTAVISLGGADGTEIEYILKNSPISKGVLVEYDDDLAEIARAKSRELTTFGKELRVLTGDAVQKLTNAINLVTNWRQEGSITYLLVTIHALLHELPNRAGHTTDIEAFLARLLEPGLPGRLVLREPCAPRDLPDTVYLHADCDPNTLAKLANRIRTTYPTVFPEDYPLPMHEKVRMSSRLAAETIVKIFYLDSLSYEIDEVVTAFTRDELLNTIRVVFGTDNVRHTDLQSDSFDKFWSTYGFRLTDSANRELPRPQLHIAFEVSWIGDLKNRDPHLQDESTPKPDTPAKASPSSAVVRARDARSEHPLPDVFTPGISSDNLRAALSSVISGEQIERVINISRSAITAVEEGDFAKQAELGEDLIAVAGELPDFHASGMYFAAEGYRLLADIEADSSLKSEFRGLAADYYADAIRLMPEAPSAYRGLGRIREIEGNLDDAMRLFDIAHGYALAGYAAGSTLPRAPALAHEILRTSRHRLHCILGMKQSDPHSKWNLEVNAHEIQGDTAKADRHHREYMKLFRSNPRWMYIEGFMAMVFLARAWGAARNTTSAAHYFLEALFARRRLLDSGRDLTIVEIANLRWWSSNVLATEGLRTQFYEEAESLAAMLNSPIDALALLRRVDEIIQPVRAATEILPGS